MTKKILIVEDEEPIRTILKLFLVRLSYKIYEAKNGLEGYGMARQFEPDLIITDLMMPVMDGIALVRSIRADEKLKDTPIVVLTGGSGDLQRDSSLAGANAVLTKPISRREIIEVIDSILERRE
jgi:adenylate cyclase